MLRFIALVCFTVCVFADGKYDYSTYKKDDYNHKWYNRMYDFGNIGGGISGISVGSGTGRGIGSISVGNGVGEGISGISPGSGFGGITFGTNFGGNLFGGFNSVLFGIRSGSAAASAAAAAAARRDAADAAAAAAAAVGQNAAAAASAAAGQNAAAAAAAAVGQTAVGLPPRPLPLLLPHLISLGSTAPSHTVVNTSTATHHITMGSHISTTVFPFITLTLSNLLDLVDLLPPQLELPLFLLEPPLEV